MQSVCTSIDNSVRPHSAPAAEATGPSADLGTLLSKPESCRSGTSSLPQVGESESGMVCNSVEWRLDSAWLMDTRLNSLARSAAALLGAFYNRNPEFKHRVC